MTEPLPIHPPTPGDTGVGGYSGPPRNNYEDHQPTVSVDIPYYGTVREGLGRWARLHDLSGFIGVVWTDDDQNLSIYPARGVSVAHLIQAIQAAKATGAPATQVFDAYAGWASQSHWAEAVQSGDLATLSDGM